MPYQIHKEINAKVFGFLETRFGHLNGTVFWPLGGLSWSLLGALGEAKQQVNAIFVCLAVRGPILEPLGLFRGSQKAVPLNGTVFLAVGRTILEPLGGFGGGKK